VERVIKDQKIKEWQVFADLAPVQEIISRENEKI